MVSELIETTNDSAVSKFYIKRDNIFCEDNFLQESGIIENIAQTAAAMTGYKAVIDNLPVKNGYIGAVNNLNIYCLPKAENEIITKIKIENVVMNANIISAAVFQDESKIAECEMRIFIDN